MNSYIKSVLRNINSALRYEYVTYANGEYVPGNDITADTVYEGLQLSPFKGLHISVAGNVAIRGVDDVVVILTLPAGCWPYGGTGIVEDGTTSTGIIALF